MSLAQAGCVLGMRLVPLPVGDEGGERRARQQMARGVAVALRASAIEGEVDHAAIEQGRRQRLLSLTSQVDRGW